MLDELIDLLLVGLLVVRCLFVVFLELDHFFSSLGLLRFFDFVESLFFCQSLLEHLLVALLLLLLSDCSELSLGCVMVDELEVSLPVKNKLLTISFMISSDLLSPLLLEHLLLHLLLLVFAEFVLILKVVLPVEDAECFQLFLILVFDLVLLSLDLLLVVEFPELGEDLLFEDVPLEFLLLVHQLLFSLDLAAGDHELGLLLPQLVGFHFEFTLQGLSNAIVSLLVPCSLEDVELLLHPRPDLSRSFQLHEELLLKALLLFSEHLGQLGSPDVEIGDLASVHGFNLTVDDFSFDRLIRLRLPIGLQEQVLVALQGVEDLHGALRWKKTRLLSL